MAPIIGVVGLDEGIAKLRQVLLGDADAVVGDDKLDVLAGFPGRDAHPAARIGELDGVRDHVEQHLLAGALVGDELRHAGRHLGDQRQLPLPRPHAA